MRNDLFPRVGRFNPPAEVLYYGGGGRQQMPVQPSPREQAEAREWEAQQQANRDRIERERQDEIRRQDEARRLEQWRGGRATAVNNVRSNARNRLQTYGLDENDRYGIWNSFTSKLDNANAGLQEGQEYAGVLNDSIFDQILADTRGRERSRMSRELDSAVSDNWLDDTFRDTVDDDILESILGEQFTEAETSVRNARDRGQMNEFAFNNALSDLGKERTRARGELETIGRGVITTGREGVARGRDGVRSRINAFDFGDNINVGDETSRIQRRATDALGALGTDIRRSVGSRKFFDPNSIIAKSSAAAGASNYNGNPGSSGAGALLTVFSDQQRNKQQEGAF